MPTIKISELPAVSTPIISTDLFNTSKDQGATYESQKATAANLGTYVRDNVVVNSSSFSSTSSFSMTSATSSILQAPSGSGTWKVLVNITSGSLDFIYS